MRMKVMVVGLGYVSTVTAACLAAGARTTIAVGDSLASGLPERV